MDNNRPRRNARAPRRYGADAANPAADQDQHQDRQAAGRQRVQDAVPLQVLQDHAPLLAMQRQLQELVAVQQELLRRQQEPPVPAPVVVPAAAPVAVVPAVAPAPIALTVKKMPPYDGTGIFNLYRVQFEEVARSQNWNDETKRAILLQALKGAALNVLKHLPQPITFESLDKELV